MESAARPAPEERRQPGAPETPGPWSAPGAPPSTAPGRWRWQYLGDAAVLLTCWLSTSFAVAFVASSVPTESVWWNLCVFLVWPIALLADCAVLLRRSRPVLACLVTCGAALLLPFDSVAALFVLPWVMARSRSKVAWGAAVLTALATAAALVRDWARGTDAVLSFTDGASGTHQEFPVLGYVIVGVVVLGAAVIRGVVRRMQLVSADADLVQRTVEDLRSELSTETIRQDERDLIARELHDTVAHHLSLVALRASALEVSSSAEVGEAARSVRSTAHDALEEMRDLIGVLRQGQHAPGPAPGRTLVDIPTLVDTVRAGGADVSAIVYVSGPSTAPRALAQAVYRIVQESLTNALKHAPGSRVDLDLRAAPGFGVQLRVRNPMVDDEPAGHPVDEPAGHPVDEPAGHPVDEPAGHPVDEPAGSPVGRPTWTPPVSGAGLVGMRERAAAVGGSVECGPVTDDHAGRCWEVRAQLPWPVDKLG